jgi:hypothetical protein
MAGDWTCEENDAIVADYFALLADDIARRLKPFAMVTTLFRASVPLQATDPASKAVVIS